MAFNFIPKIVYGSGPTTISFDFPPKGFDSEGVEVSAEGRVSEAVGGALQSSVNFIEETRDITLEMLTPALKTALDTFLQTHALLGESFDYYPHKSESTFYTVTLDATGRKYKPERMTPSGRFRLRLKMRRVL